jgi:hypothetical protein
MLVCVPRVVFKQFEHVLQVSSKSSCAFRIRLILTLRRGHSGGRMYIYMCVCVCVCLCVCMYVSGWVSGLSQCCEEVEYGSVVLVTMGWRGHRIISTL